MNNQTILKDDSTKRNGIIDVLRFLGLSLIILAHTNPNEYIFQLRNFDVPLMFIVMGMSYNITSSKQRTKVSYITSRFRRIILPTWIFLALIFTACYLCYLTFNLSKFHFTQYEILSSFSLARGIGYVWVIRLFFAVSVIAVLAPKRIYQVNIFVIYLASFLVIAMSDNLLGDWYKEIDHRNDILLLGSFYSNVIPYTLIFLIGTKLLNCTSKQLYLLLLISLLIFSVVVVYNFLMSSTLYPTQTDKYPPGIYYISYSFFMSLLSLIAIRKIKLIYNLANIKAVIFISSNSIWIYLWHIVFVMITDKTSIWFIWRYLLVYTCAIIIFLIQHKLITLWTKKLNDVKIKKIITSIFTG